MEENEVERSRNKKDLYIQEPIKEGAESDEDNTSIIKPSPPKCQSCKREANPGCLWKKHPLLKSHYLEFMLWNIGGKKMKMGLQNIGGKERKMEWFREPGSLILSLLHMHSPTYMVLCEHLVPPPESPPEEQEIDTFREELRHLNYEIAFSYATRTAPYIKNDKWHEDPYGGTAVIYQRGTIYRPQVVDIRGVIINIFARAQPTYSLEFQGLIRNYFLTEGRVIVVDTQGFLLLGVYAPNTCFSRKIKMHRDRVWDPFFPLFLSELKRIYRKSLICLGDFNVDLGSQEPHRHNRNYVKMVEQFGFLDLGGLDSTHPTLSLDKVLIEKKLLVHRVPSLRVFPEIEMLHYDIHRPILLTLKQKFGGILKSLSQGIKIPIPCSEEEIRLSVVEESKEKLNKNEGKRISEGSEESKLVINLINASEETRESVTLLNNKICPECQKEVFRSDLITCSECKDKYCVYCYKHNKGCNDVHICTNCLFCVYCKQYHCASCSLSICNLDKLSSHIFDQKSYTERQFLRICRYLLHSTKTEIRSLSFRDNLLGVAGAQILGQFIAKRKLIYLCVRNCKIGDIGGIHLASNLKYSKLETFNADENNLTDHSGVEFVNFIKESELMNIELSLQENSFSEEMKNNMRTDAEIADISLYI